MHLFASAIILGLALAILSPSPVRADSEDGAAGYVRLAHGNVRLLRDGVAISADVGDPVLPGDTIESGDDGSIGVTFRDDCRISLGPRSRLDLRAFEFAPASRRYSFVARLTEGSLHYISGLIAKLAPGRASIETPVGTIAVRGTRFLVRVAAP
ncbi:MAG: hypothetical protein JWL84_4508 [Rhodospirillales bacterium]|nr:hypothetical protein [Rhodospirillales bacterium]